VVSVVNSTAVPFKMEEAPPTDGTPVVDGGADGPPSVTLGPNLIVAAAVESNIRALFKSGAPSMEVGCTTRETMPAVARACRSSSSCLALCSLALCCASRANSYASPRLTVALRAVLLLQPMTMHGFTEVLTSAGAKREYCTQFFKAFDRNHDNFVDYDEFLLGMVAMV
jgi:hypothetical protein